MLRHLASQRHKRLVSAVLISLIVIASTSCNEMAPPSEYASSSSEVSIADTPTSPTGRLEDFFERTESKIVGITYPPNMERFPDLAALLSRYANARRDALNAIIHEWRRPSAPYELTLRFTTIADAPRMFVVSADEELFTGGHTSQPSHRIFLWLPAERRLISPDEIIPSAVAWAKLRELVSQREREESAAMASSGATQESAICHCFVPRFNSSGQIAGLSFEVHNGNYVEVPSAIIKPLVAPAFSGWFEGAPTTASALAAAIQ